MMIESYDMMKITFEYFCSDLFSPCEKNPLYVIVYEESSDYIRAGWQPKQKLDEIYSDLYVIVDEYEMRNFNRTIYEEKIDELQLLIKKEKVKKKLKDLESDFV